MKLDTIHKSDDVIMMFHGTDNIDSIFKDGLLINQKTRIGDTRKGLYLGKLSVAAAYGKYLLEILVDKKQDYLADEDDLVRMADPNDINWLNNTNVQNKYKRLVHDSVMDYGGWEANNVPHIAELISKLRIKSKEPTSIMIPHNIGYSGPNRIIAIYEIEKIEKTRAEEVNYQCKRVLYGKGSLKEGQIFKGKSSIYI